MRLKGLNVWTKRGLFTTREDKVVAGKSVSSSPGYLLKIKGSILPPSVNLIKHSFCSVRNYGQNEF